MFKLEIDIKSHQYHNIGSAKRQIFLMYNYLNTGKGPLRAGGKNEKNIPLSFKKQENSISLPLKRKRFTVLRSPHIDKRSREHFELKNMKTRLSFSFTEKRFFSFFVFLLKNSKFPASQLELCLTSSTFSGRRASAKQNPFQPFR